jgi:hypothetical protein
VPLPSYTSPTLRSSWTPNPFDQSKPQRLRIFIDQPLETGPVDGHGEYHGYPFIGSGSTGFPDTATVLRSYLGHEALEIWLASDELDERDLEDYPEAIREVDEMSTKHGIDADDAHDGVLLYRVGSDREADLIVTAREWLLAERGRPHGSLLANVVSPQEAMAIIGLHLRWHQQPIIIGGVPVRWYPSSMRHSVAYVAMPAFERWNQAGRVWFDTKNDLTLEHLNKTLLIRISRAFQFRDRIFALSITMAEHEPEDMLCDLDSLLFSLVGAFDVAARVTDLVLQLNSGRRAAWQNTQNRGWQPNLEPVARDLFDHTKVGTEMQHAFRVLRDLRNSVHNEALDLTRADGTFYLTTETQTQGKLRDFLREGHPGWTTTTLGVKVQPPGGVTQGKWLPGVGRYSVTVRRTGAPRPADPLDGKLVLDVRRLVNKLFPACLTALDTIMKHLPLTTVPGYNANVHNPSRVNLPWQLSDTTGHRLRMLYGITELA